MKLNFYLRNHRKGKPSSVALYLSLNNKQYIFGTGITCMQSKWDKRKQRTRTDSKSNTVLSKIEANVQEYLSDIAMSGKPVGIETLKQEIKTIINRLKGNVLLLEDESAKFWEAWKEFVQEKEAEVTENRMKKIRTTEKHLKGFEEIYLKLSFDRMSPETYALITEYLLFHVKLVNNSAKTYIVTTKAFLTWSRKRGYHNITSHEEWKAREDKTDSISLTKEELKRIIDVELEDERLDRVRDLFVFLCHTGQRYGDTQKPLDIRNGFWYNIQNKTKGTRPVEIPLSPKAQEILRKYNGKLPKISNQKANDYLKEIGQLAGITDTMHTRRFRGKEPIDETFERWEKLSTHVGRHTFSSLAVSLGLSDELIKSVTGHKDQRSFATYVNMNGEQKKKALEGVWE
ncbi:site-specific integrase [Algivirga pacifica]|uniref:Site-specific integrase n=1 Tax=Algivirga pacifica TaxID=1162670 RepID=A0ABP9DJZ2_9BACT